MTNAKLFYVSRLWDTYGWGRNNAAKPQGMFSISAHPFSFQACPIQPAGTLCFRMVYACLWALGIWSWTSPLSIPQLSSHKSFYAFQTPTPATEGPLYPHSFTNYTGQSPCCGFIRPTLVLRKISHQSQIPCFSWRGLPQLPCEEGRAWDWRGKVQHKNKPFSLGNAKKKKKKNHPLCRLIFPGHPWILYSFNYYHKHTGHFSPIFLYLVIHD